VLQVSYELANLFFTRGVQLATARVVAIIMWVSLRSDELTGRQAALDEVNNAMLLASTSLIC
jgi:hypothetical protein